MSRPLVDHIGIVVKDLDAAVSLFENIFNLKSAERKDISDVGLRVAQLDAQNIRFELLQYTGAQDGFAQAVMGSQPGINHFSIQVKDIQAAIRYFLEKGVRIMDGFPRPGSHGQVAFFEPDTTAGILIEVCQPEE